MQCLIRSKAKQQKSSLLADSDCRLYHLQGIDMSLSLSVCSMINCFCLPLCKCGQTRPLHNNVSTVQTTGRNKKHGLLISNLALGEQGFTHSGERSASVYDTHIPRPSNSASLQPSLSFVFYITYMLCLGASVFCSLRSQVFFLVFF